MAADRNQEDVRDAEGRSRAGLGSSVESLLKSVASEVAAEENTWYSAEVELPAEAEATIAAYVAEHGPTSRTVAIHGALYGYRASIWTREAVVAELKAMLREGLDDVEAGRVTEDSDAFWDDVKRRGERSVRRVRELQASGALGSLLLPKELFDFIGHQIAAGRQSTPTDVVLASLPYLRATSERKTVGK